MHAIDESGFMDIQRAQFIGSHMHISKLPVGDRVLQIEQNASRLHSLDGTIDSGMAPSSPSQYSGLLIG